MSVFINEAAKNSPVPVVVVGADAKTALVVIKI